MTATDLDDPEQYLSAGDRTLRMGRDPLLSTESKITILFVVVGLTAWYVVRQASTSTELALVTLLGVGVVVPTIVNEWRRRADG
jgi:hypothetical protein